LEKDIDFLARERPRDDAVVEHVRLSLAGVIDPPGGQIARDIEPGDRQGY
jgi:hypothetical protein